MMKHKPHRKVSLTRAKAMKAGEVAKSDLLGILMDSNLNENQQAAARNNKNSQLG